MRSLIRYCMFSLLLMIAPSLSHAQSWSSCTADSSCVFTSLWVDANYGSNFDGTIPDDGRGYIVRAFVTAGYSVAIQDLNEINNRNYYRDGMGGVYVNFGSVSHEFSGPTYVGSLSNAQWAVYDYRFRPGSHPYYACDTPGPADSKCGEHTDWWWNGAGVSVSGPNGTANVRLALIAVPEPASWAMLIVGFGLIGGIARRRAPAPALA